MQSNEKSECISKLIEEEHLNIVEDTLSSSVSMSSSSDSLSLHDNRDSLDLDNNTSLDVSLSASDSQPIWTSQTNEKENIDIDEDLRFPENFITSGDSLCLSEDSNSMDLDSFIETVCSEFTKHDMENCDKTDSVPGKRSVGVQTDPFEELVNNKDTHMIFNLDMDEAFQHDGNTRSTQTHILYLYGFEFKYWD